MDRGRTEIYGRGFIRGFGQEDEDEEKTVAEPNRVVRGRCRRTSDAFGVRAVKLVWTNKENDILIIGVLWIYILPSIDLSESIGHYFIEV